MNQESLGNTKRSSRIQGELKESTEICDRTSRSWECCRKVHRIHSRSLMSLESDLKSRYHDVYKTRIYHPDVLIVSSEENEAKAREVQRIIQGMDLCCTGVFDIHSWAIPDFWDKMIRRSTVVVYLMTQSLVDKDYFHYIHDRLHKKPVVNVPLEDVGRQEDGAPLYIYSSTLSVTPFELLPKCLESIFVPSLRIRRYKAEMTAITKFQQERIRNSLQSTFLAGVPSLS